MLEDTLKKINVDLDILAEMLKEKENILEKSEYKKCVEWIIEHKNTLLSTKNDESIDNVLSGVLAKHIEKLINLLEDNSDKCLEQINICKNDVNYFLSTIKSREEKDQLVVNKDKKNDVNNEILTTDLEQVDNKKVEIIEGNNMDIELSNLGDLLYYLQKIQLAYTEIKENAFLEEKTTIYLLECFENVNNYYYDLISNLINLEGMIDQENYVKLQTNLDQNLRDFQNNLKNIYKSILNNNRMYLSLDTINDYNININNEYYVDILKDKRVEKHLRDVSKKNVLNNLHLFLDELSYIIDDCEKINNISFYDQEITDDVDVFGDFTDDPIQYLSNLNTSNDIDKRSNDSIVDNPVQRLNDLLSETGDLFDRYNKKEEKIDSDVDYSSWFEDIKSAEDAINKEEQEAYDNNRLSWNKARELQNKRKKLGGLSERLNEFDEFFQAEKKDKPKLKKFGLGSYLKSMLIVKLTKSPYEDRKIFPEQIDSYKKK